MEMTDLKAAIDEYSDAAENGILGLKDRLDVMETKMVRPGAADDSFFGTDEHEHKDAFIKGFMQKGDDSGIKMIESKALSTGGTGGDGGYAVPTVIDAEIEKQLQNLSPMRSIVKVKTIETSKYTRLVNTGGTTSGWVDEATSDRSIQTGTPSLQEVSITPGEIYANAAATQRAIDDMQFDAEAWLQEEVAEEFAVKEGDAIVNGDGVNMPKGFLTYPAAVNDDVDRTFGNLQYIPSGANGDFIDSDVLVDVVHKLNARYRQGAKFVMNSKTLAAVRKLKDNTGNFIWLPGIAAGQPDSLLGYPVVESEDMPDMALDSFSVAFGDFSRAYTLVERTGTRVLRDPYTNKPYVHFYATRRVGGALVNDDALKLIKFGLA